MFNLFRRRCEWFTCSEKSRHWCRYGHRWFGCLQASSRYDFTWRQLCFDRNRRGGGSFDLWQPKEVHRLHPDFEHTRNLAFFGVHPLRYSFAAGYRHYSLHRFRNWYGESRNTIWKRWFESNNNIRKRLCASLFKAFPKLLLDFLLIG